MYAIRSYYGRSGWVYRCPCGNRLFHTFFHRDRLSHRHRPIRCWFGCVITSYSIHYTKLYDVAFGAKFTDRDTGYPKTDGVHNNGVHMNQLGNEMLATGDAGTFNKWF